MIYPDGPLGFYYSYPWYRSFCDQRSIRPVSSGGVPTEHISLAKARQHLSLTTYGSPPGHPHDEMIEQVYIPAARAICESISGRAFVTSTWEVVASQYPTAYVAYTRPGIKLLGPVRGGVTVETLDETGAYVAADPTTYTVDPYTDGGYLYAASGTTWPTIAPTLGAIRVRFVAGYDVAGESPGDYPLPPQYLWAMYLALAHIYNNPSNTTAADLREIPLGIRSLLERDSMVNGFA